MDCRRCGACCMTFYTDGTEPGRCEYLRGEPGKQTSCALQERKPDGCRYFEPGSELCLANRDQLAAWLRRTA